MKAKKKSKEIAHIKIFSDKRGGNSVKAHTEWIVAICSFLSGNMEGKKTNPFKLCILTQQR